VSKKRTDSRQARKRRMRNRARRIQNRLGARSGCSQGGPAFSASNIHFDVAERTRASGVGGIGLMHRLAGWSGLIEAIDTDLELLEVHKPYHESDHVLNIAYNVLAGGACLEDLELLRNDETYLDALGASRIPDPTTAGDFCRRFEVRDVDGLMDIINERRLHVWGQQPPSFFDEAVIDADGTLVPTTGQCKQGMALTYKGEWGYQVLLVSLRNTAEPLYLVNRSGNRPSSEGAAERLDQAIALSERAGFEKISLRGDTDFSLTRHLDRWDARGVRFVFGYDAYPNVVAIAESLPKRAWTRLERPVSHRVATEPRARPRNEKERIVEERGYKNLKLDWEDVAEFEYSPTHCESSYRLVALRKKIGVHEGQRRLFDEYRYFFYITNERVKSAAQIVFDANARCNQENLIGQLKSGVRALRAPTGDLLSNWAYMVMASLAWTLKAWLALALPETGRWSERYRAEKDAVQRMEFRTFVNAFMRIPAQIVKGARRILYRLLSWNPWQHVFLRAVEALDHPLRC
jgi:hypothetical protein